MLPLNFFKRRTWWMFVLFFLVTGGCAGMGQLQEKPKISIADIQVLEMKSMEAAFLVQLRVMNPNEVPLDIRGVDCDLEIDGRHFAQGIASSPQKIPAYGTALVPVNVYASMMNMISSVVGLIQANNTSAALQPLSYKLAGNIRLGTGGLTQKIPFESTGELSLQGFNAGQ